MDEFKHTIQTVYAAFNARDLDKVLLLFHEDVQWPNAWEGGVLQGRDAVRSYWERQFKELDSIVEPILIRERQDGLVEVRVHQLVKDLQGKVLHDVEIIHLYTFKDGLIQNMNFISPD